MKNRSLLCVFVGTLLLCFMPADRSGGSAPEQEANQKILVEIFLASDRKGDLETIKKEFAAVSITKVRPQFFKLGNPPQNIAIGRNRVGSIAMTK